MPGLGTDSSPALRALALLVLGALPFAGCQCNDEGFSDADLEITPATVDFGDVTFVPAPNGRTATRTITVSNLGGVPASFGLSLREQNLDFGFDPASARVQAASDVVITLTYTPSSLGADTDILVLRTEGGAEVEVILTGRGVENADPQADVFCIPREGGTLARCRLVDFGITGGMVERTVTVRNDDRANGMLDITGVEAEGAGYSVVDPGANISLAPGEDIDVTVRFDPSQTSGTAQGCLLIRSNDPDTAPDGAGVGCIAGGFHEYRSPWQVNLLAVAGGATIEICTQTGDDAGVRDCLAPHDIDFGNVPANTTVERGMWVRNTGTLPFQLTSVALGAGASGEFGLMSAAALPVEVPQQGEAAFTVTYTPIDASTDLADVVIMSTDPGSPTLQVSVFGESQPDIDVTPNGLEFAEVPQGEARSGMITVSNVGNAQLRVTGVDFSTGHAAWTIDGGAPALPQNLTPGGSFDLTLSYQNPNPGGATASLRITSNDPDEGTFEVLLFGSNVNNLPPVANAGDDVVRFGYDPATPEEITVDGSASTDDQDMIQSYAWELTDKPGNSAATLSTMTGETTSITPDQLGVYTLQLTVTDDLGQTGTDEVNITVQQ